jgi:pimeloyl-ACP methyl ester carboxylesterase
MQALTLIAALGAAIPPAHESATGCRAADERDARAASSALAPEPTTGEVTSKDGTRIGFARSGAGPVLVLVGGALSDRSGLEPLAALLAEEFTVINYDRRGRGASGDTPPYAIAREVEDIEALIDAAGGSASVFGHSSGAVLALEAANALPTKVAKLAMFEPPFVLDDSRPRVPADFVAHVTELVAAGKRGDAVAYFMEDGVGLPSGVVDQMRAMPMWPGLEALAHTLAYDGTLMGGTQAGQPLPTGRWTAVEAPALVMSGGASDAWLHTAAGAAAELLPRAEHRVLKGLDHSAAITAPQVLAPVLVEFFAD